MTYILLLAVFGGLAYRITSPDERSQYLAFVMARVRRLKAEATKQRPEYDAFREALRARTHFLLVTPSIVAINAIVVLGMILGAGAIGDPDTLVAWGASLGPRTTNGEWWRLATSAFVHTGLLHFLVDAAVLIELGAVLERLVGRPTFAAVYLASAGFATLVNLSFHPIAASVGATGAIFGLYGLLAAALAWEGIHRLRGRSDLNEDDATAPLTIPISAMKRLGVGAALFVAYSAVSGHAYAAEFSGLLVGLGFGIVLARRVRDEQPGGRLVGAALAVAAVAVVAAALPLRHIADVAPEISRVVATETRTAVAYRAALDAFNRGRLNAEALAQLAERTIVPELQAADARLEALSNVPPENQFVVTDAREYLRLRCQSWRVRAEAIRKTSAAPRRPAAEPMADASWRIQAEARHRANMIAMGNAEAAERASLEAFDRLRQETARTSKQAP